MGSNVYRKFLKLYSSLISLLMISMLLSSAALGQSWNNDKNSISGLLQGVEINQDITKSAVLNKVISVKMGSATVLEALEKVADQADLELIYNALDLESVSHRLTLNVEEMTVNQALWTILEDTGFRFAVSSHGQLVIMKSHDQDRMEKQRVEDYLQVTVTGQVVDNQTGEALPGVNVIVAGSEEETGSIIGTQTDLDGNYSINVPDGLHTLAFTYIGYQRLEVDIDGRSNIDIQLQQDIQMLDDVVVVGYAEQRQATLTGAVSRVNSEEITNIPVSQMSQSLQGRISGVTVTQNMGAPGSNTATIRIRGIGTLGNSNPLVLIDGVEGNINDINPNVVENISVLKDAASSSIYGSRAANGVILITTKRGDEQLGLNASYRSIVGFETPTNLPNLVDGEDYIRLTNESRTNENRAPVFDSAFVENYGQNRGSEEFPDTDWYQAAMNSYSLQQQHHITLSGGSGRFRVFGSLGYTQQDGLVANTDFRRYSVNVNTDYLISDKLTASTDISLIQGLQKQPSTGINALFRMMSEVPPIYNAQYSDGTWGEGWQGANPLARALDGGSQNTTNSTVQLITKLSYNPTDAIQLEAF